MATKQSLQAAVDGAMLGAVACLRQVLEALRHELTALHGLYAYDGAAPGEPWQLDLAVPLAQIDLALAGAGPAVEAVPGGMTPEAIRAAIHTMRTRMNSSPVYLKPTVRMDAPEGMIHVSTAQTPDPAYTPPLADELLSIREWLERHHAELDQGQYPGWQKCDCVLCVAIGRLDMLGRRVPPDAKMSRTPGVPAPAQAFAFEHKLSEREIAEYRAELDRPAPGTTQRPRNYARPSRVTGTELEPCARAAHDAFFDASYEPWDFVGGIERQLWHQVAAAVLAAHNAPRIEAASTLANEAGSVTTAPAPDAPAPTPARAVCPRCGAPLIIISAHYDIGCSACAYPLAEETKAPALCPWCGYAANISAHGDGVCNRTDGVRPK